jgi:hypothetical protein
MISVLATSANCPGWRIALYLFRLKGHLAVEDAPKHIGFVCDIDYVRPVEYHLADFGLGLGSVQTVFCR